MKGDVDLSDSTRGFWLWFFLWLYEWWWSQMYQVSWVIFDQLEVELILVWHLYLFKHIISMYKHMRPSYIHLRRLWYHGYHRREMGTVTRVQILCEAVYISNSALGKLWIQTFSLQWQVNNEAESTQILNMLKIDGLLQLLVWNGRYIYIYIYIYIYVRVWEYTETTTNVKTSMRIYTHRLTHLHTHLEVPVV